MNDLPNVTVIHVDQISQLKDDNLKKRAAEIPKAKRIIEEQVKEFMQWHEMRRQVPVLRSIKSKLKEINQFRSFNTGIKQNAFNPLSVETKIQEVINSIAVKMLTSECKGCYYIEAINQFIMADAS